MNKKLTLSLNPDVISEAKIFARKHQVSLSRLIENYLKTLVEKSKDKSVSSHSDPGTTIVKEITGIADYNRVKDIDDERFNYLMNKYS